MMFRAFIERLVVQSVDGFGRQFLKIAIIGLELSFDRPRGKGTYHSFEWAVAGQSLHASGQFPKAIGEVKSAFAKDSLEVIDQ